MPVEERERIAKIAHRGNEGSDLSRFWSEYGLDKVSRGCINILFLPPVDEFFVDSLSDCIVNNYTDLSGRQLKAFSMVLNRIVFGLCLYLSSLTPEERERHVRWSRGQVTEVQKGDPRKSETIGDETEVCMVTSAQKISDRHRELLRRIMQSEREISLPGPHFCQGHWRRPPGKGHDPNAPRTVWVRPYETGMDQLGENELPGGAIVKVE